MRKYVEGNVSAALTNIKERNVELFGVVLFNMKCG